MKRIVEEHKHLLFYALRYEGMEQSPNIVYGGAVPNQLVMPAVHWALENLGKPGATILRGKRVYLVGSDYVYSRVVNILIKDLLACARRDSRGGAIPSSGVRCYGRSGGGYCRAAAGYCIEYHQPHG